ncbi:MAG TPA: ATP-binding protein, partial [Crocinitomicaceae bacterium]|nr:ATP-binding protein [Crocinitomicaceae bacterium]
DVEQVLSDQNWLSIGRRLGVSLNDAPAWQIAKTDTFLFVYEQLAHCQQNSVSGMLCDRADIGKTFTAKNYVRDNKNAVYIDCSQVKSRQKLIRKIAQEYGVNHTGKYADVYADLVYYLQSIVSPLVVLDEAGDLDYPAFLELKALWNATEGVCAWYMMGADGLKAKIESNKSRLKVGFAEIFSRFGSNYQKVSPDGKEALEQFSKMQLALVVKANIPDANIQQVYAQTLGSLRKTFDYAKKIRA